MHPSVTRYIEKYAPSLRRLHLYCAKWNVVIPPGFDEKVSIKYWGAYYIASFFPKRKIIQKLRIKGFRKESIDAVIALEDFSDFSLYEGSLRSRIMRGLEQGKSLGYIENSLKHDFTQFRSEIHELMREYSEDDAFMIAQKRARERYNLDDPREYQKYLSYLLRRGYTEDRIRKTLERRK